MSLQPSGFGKLESLALIAAMGIPKILANTLFGSHLMPWLIEALHNMFGYCKFINLEIAIGTSSKAVRIRCFKLSPLDSGEALDPVSSCQLDWLMGNIFCMSWAMCSE